MNFYDFSFFDPLKKTLMFLSCTFIIFYTITLFSYKSKKVDNNQKK